MRHARLPERFWSLEREDLKPPYPEALVKTFCDQMQVRLTKGSSVLIHGNNGTGKSTASAFALKSALPFTRRVLWVLSYELIRSVIAHEMFDDYQSVDEAVHNRHLLVIDDFGKEYRGSGSGYAESYLENLIRFRVQHKLSTVISTNLALDEIRKTYGKSMLSILHEGYAHVSTASFTDKRLPQNKGR